MPFSVNTNREQVIQQMGKTKNAKSANSCQKYSTASALLLTIKGKTN